MGPKTRKALAIRATEIQLQKRGGEELPLPIKTKILEKFQNPAEILVLLRRQQEDPLTAKEDYASIACAVQNMSLLCWQEGFGSKWGTGALTREASTYRLCDVNPNEWTIEGFFYVGRPLNETKKPQKTSVEATLKELP
jgi:hypothetical protein